MVWALPTFGQFAPEFVQNASYWNDGKAEFNIYDAKIVRYGQPRQSEVLHILVREPFDPEANRESGRLAAARASSRC